jgi:hypothetical protein
VALLGFILRSKLLFSLSWINYLYLLDVHSHFAFGGWVTLALLFLMVTELLPKTSNEKPIYQWLFGGIVLGSFGILFTMPFNDKSFLAAFFSFLFILITYIFSWTFLKDIKKTRLNKTVRLLGVSAIVCLVLSSAGPITIAWLQAIKSLNGVLYQEALYIYLHLQYNGFFTLSVFALLFHKLYPIIPKRTQKDLYLFSVLICISIFPSLFLSFLWQNPNFLFRIVAMTGSFLVFVSVAWFISPAYRTLKFSRLAVPSVRYILLVAITAFVLKMLLQSLTIFPLVGNAVFGDRPVIIGFLHLVFLGFVSPFILAYYTQKNMLNIRLRLTGYALIIFISGAIFNEIVLMIQGLGVMFLKGSIYFYWLLWITSLWLLAGAILILTARMKSRTFFSKTER